MFPYVLPQVQTPKEIETETNLVDDEFINLKTKFDEVNDVVTELKKQQKITDLIDDVIDEKIHLMVLKTTCSEKTNFLTKKAQKKQLKFQKIF